MPGRRQQESSTAPLSFWEEMDTMKSSMDKMMDQFFGGRYWDPFNVLADVDQPGNVMKDDEWNDKKRSPSKKSQTGKQDQSLSKPEITSEFPCNGPVAIDVREGEKGYKLVADVPGVPKENVKLDVEGDKLKITADRSEEKEEKGSTWHRVERRSGAMTRTLKLPQNAETEGITAKCANGVLYIHLPKKIEHQAKRRRIDIK